MPRNEHDKTVFFLEQITATSRDIAEFTRAAQWIDGCTQKNDVMNLDHMVSKLNSAIEQSKSEEQWLTYSAEQVATLLYWRANKTENKNNGWNLSEESRSILEGLLPKKIADDPIRKTNAFIDTEKMRSDKNLGRFIGRKQFLLEQLDKKFHVELIKTKDDLDLFLFLEKVEILDSIKKSLLNTLLTFHALSDDIVEPIKLRLLYTKEEVEERSEKPLSFFSNHNSKGNYGTFSEKPPTFKK